MKPLTTAMLCSDNYSYLDIDEISEIKNDLEIDKIKIHFIQ